MESIGQRISTLRKREQWSRPELGRRMAVAIAREKPFSGELIRQYEADVVKPGGPARGALAIVFKRSEAWLEFGDGPQKVRSPIGAYEIPRTGDPSAQEQILLHLFAGLFKLQKRAVINEMYALYLANEVTRKELGQKPLHGISDAQIEAAFGNVPAPHAKKKPKKKHNGGRDPGAAMSDYTEDP